MDGLNNTQEVVAKLTSFLEQNQVEETNEEELEILGSGAHLGEIMAFLMPKDAFQHLIESDDRLARKIYQAFASTLMGRLRETNAQFPSFKDKQQTEMADIFGIKE